MGLDINTPKGEIFKIKEITMLKYVSKCWNIKIKTTKKDQPIPYDGVLIIDDKIIGIFESKNREYTLEEFEDFKTWLVTFSKLEKCRLIAKEMKVPFYGFLGIEPDKLVMCFKISNENGKYLFDFKHEYTLTQKTVNGGEIIRDNAYLPIKFGKFVQPNQNFYDI